MRQNVPPLLVDHHRLASAFSTEGQKVNIQIKAAFMFWKVGHRPCPPGRKLWKHLRETAPKHQLLHSCFTISGSFISCVATAAPAARSRASKSPVCYKRIRVSAWTKVSAAFKKPEIIDTPQILFLSDVVFRRRRVKQTGNKKKLIQQHIFTS